MTVYIGVDSEIRNWAAGWAAPRGTGVHLAALASTGYVELSELYGDILATMREADRRAESPGFGGELPQIWAAVCDFIASYADWGAEHPIMKCPICGAVAAPFENQWYHAGRWTWCPPRSAPGLIAGGDGQLLPVPMDWQG